MSALSNPDVIKVRKWNVPDPGLGSNVEIELATDKGAIAWFAIRLFDVSVVPRLVYECVAKEKLVVERWSATGESREAYMLAKEAYHSKKREVFRKQRVWIEDYHRRCG